MEKRICCDHGSRSFQEREDDGKETVVFENALIEGILCDIKYL